MPGPTQIVRISAPASWDEFEIAQAVLGSDLLLKAEYIKPLRRAWKNAQPLRELHEYVVGAYATMLARLLQEIQAYVEKHVVLGDLDKAQGDPEPWVLISPEQFDEVRDLIGDWHLAFVAGAINPGLLTNDEFHRLVDAGILPQDMGLLWQPKPHELPPEPRTMIADAYAFGQDMALEPMPERRKISAASWEAYKKRPKPPLSRSEREAVRWAEKHAAQYVTGLGNKISDVFGTITTDHALRQRYTEDIRDSVSRNIKKREAWRQIITDIGDKTGDWARDLGRIAATEKQRAMQEGMARALIKRHKDPKQIMVAKLPSPSACFIAGTQVMTREGPKPIERVAVGDEVLTHKLRWRRVTTLFRRQYDGVLVGVNGMRPYATGNHPFLVDGNWQRADALKTGEQIVELVIAYAQKNPTVGVQNCLFSLVTPSYFTGTHVPASSIEFYRYLQRRNSDVDVEHPDGKFEHANESSAVESLYQVLSRVCSRKPISLAVDRFFSLSGRARRQLSGFMGVFNQRFAFLRRAASGFFGAELSRAFQFQAVSSEMSTSGASCDAELVTDGLQRVPFNLVDGVGGAHIEHGKFVRHAPVYASPRQVRATARGSFVGQVFNVEVEEDHSYFANGIAVHNCPHCTRLHLDGGVPRVFPLSELEANGTNVGKKTAQWKVTVGPVHPFCECALVHVPSGWAFDEDRNLVPEELTRSERMERNLRKALSYASGVPEFGVSVRISDPEKRELAEKIISETPAGLFTSKTGVTLITTDIDRQTTPLQAEDYAYWTENEIRVMQTLPLDKFERVLRHEIAHSINVALVHKFGSVQAVRDWHDKLYALSKKEGFVSDYAEREPIENAAEATRLYLYERKRLMVRWPRTFAMLHAAYRAVLRGTDEARSAG